MDELYLFPKEVMDAMIDIPRHAATPQVPRNAGMLNSKICQYLSFTGKYEMPVVKPNQCDIPKRIVAWHRVKERVQAGCVPHFFESDNRFEKEWSAPYGCLATLSRCNAVIGTDFSIYKNWTLTQKLWNIFRNKALAAWWQYNGINVIPNVSWIYGFDPSASFDGWPRHTLIAVNSTGIGYDKPSMRQWIEYYNTMLNALQPTHILRYGAKVEGEREDISTYYPNDNLTFARQTFNMTDNGC